MDEVLILNDGNSVYAGGTVVVKEERKKLNKLEKKAKELYKKALEKRGGSEILEEEIAANFSIVGTARNLEATCIGLFIGMGSACPLVPAVFSFIGSMSSKVYKGIGNALIKFKRSIEERWFDPGELIPGEPVVVPEEPVMGPGVLVTVENLLDEEPKKRPIIFDTDLLEGSSNAETLENSNSGGRRR